MKACIGCNCLGCVHDPQPERLCWCRCMSCALQAQLRAQDSLTAECSTSYSSSRPSLLPCKRSAGYKRREISSRPRLSRAQRSSGDRQTSATAAAQSLVQLQPRPQADLSEGPGLPNFWQDSQDLAEVGAQAPDGLPKLLRLNLDLLLVRCSLPSSQELEQRLTESDRRSIAPSESSWPHAPAGLRRSAWQQSRLQRPSTGAASPQLPEVWLAGAAVCKSQPDSDRQ